MTIYENNTIIKQNIFSNYTEIQVARYFPNDKQRYFDKNDILVLMNVIFLRQ